MGCAVYARFSTDKQDILSIETQLMMCRREIERRGWEEVDCYTDTAQSGATMHRPGMQAMLAAVASGRIDIVFADAMDRLSRSQADIATLHERLRFRGGQIVTCKEGVVTSLHIGMVGTMNAEQLKAVSEKTRDALVKRHQLGKNPGGVAYGYETRIELDGNGERIRGLQQISPSEAAIVNRIFEAFAAGVSPRQIVWSLNADGVAPPRSGKRDRMVKLKGPAWSPNTLTGNAARGTGILNNQLYIGRRPYLKQTYRKNPDTGRRRAFTTKADQRAERLELPELRIVSDALWQAVKDRQAMLAVGARSQGGVKGALPFHEQQRPRYLLTGKMTCGECGASYAKCGKTRFGCQGAAKKGPTYCGNRLTIRQDELDERVLSGLSDRMLQDDILAIFLDEYEAETRRLANAEILAQADPAMDLADVRRQLSTIKAAILKGVDASIFASGNSSIFRIAKVNLSGWPRPALPAKMCRC